MKRIAIVGAGISGLTAAWQLTRPSGVPVEVTLFEASGRAGGIIETVRRDGFVIDMGPDSWVTEKLTARELVQELGLAQELIASNDSTRKTHLLLNGTLETMPDGLRMMVPTSSAALAAMEVSPLLTAAMLQAFHEERVRAPELKRTSPVEDESIASFTERHFGREVLDRLAAPLLSGVFGGDVAALSVRAVMAPFVAMERERGSLIAALEEREGLRHAAGQPVQAIFTTLRSGLGLLTDTLAEQLPPGVLQLGQRVLSLHRSDAAGHPGWIVSSSSAGSQVRKPHSPALDECFDEVVLATPSQAMAELLEPVDRDLSRLLPVAASSAILVALAWTKTTMNLPQGFGFLVPPSRTGQPAGSQLLATTFVGQKFVDRVPAGGHLLRVFFGGDSARALLDAEDSDESVIQLALRELNSILGPQNGGRLPQPALAEVRRWPLSLPQYAVKHLERTTALDHRVAGIPGLHVLGNGLRGVGLPDLIREARRLATKLLSAEI